MNVPWYTTAFGAHYPLLYRHRDRQEAVQCLDLLPRLAPLTVGGPVLDLGCGDGRHLARLAAAGHPALGLDLSPHLLLAARGNLPPEVSLVRGDMRSLPLAAGSVGGVLSLFTAFGYFGTLAHNRPVVAEVARVLEPGGHWFLDYVDCDRVRRELGDGPVHRRRHLESLQVDETRRLVDGGARVEKRVELVPLPGREREALHWGVSAEGVRYTESVALFARGEMEALARRLGLEPVAAAGSYRGDPCGQGPRWIMVFCLTGSVSCAEPGGLP